MKKLIAMTAAAGALAFGGAASAQDIGAIISNLFGLGAQQYNYSAPAIVAPQQQIYADRYGRHFYYDQYGRQVYLSNSASQVIGYDNWGRPIYNNGYGVASGAGTGYAYGSTWDRDGDGIANTRDRWPNDPRYW